MALRNGHGNGAGVPRIEVLPADELPAGVPGPARPAPTGDRRADGQLVPGESTTALASLGGRARAERLRLERLLGRVDLPDDHPLLPYRRDAADWRDAHLARLAATVGGGECGPAVQAIVSTAALQHAASRWLFDRSVLEASAALALQASRLGDAARQNLLAAHELCAKEAAARPRDPADHHRRAAEMFAAAPVTLPAAASAPSKTTRGPSGAESRSEGPPDASNRNSVTGATEVQE